MFHLGILSRKLFLNLKPIHYKLQYHFPIYRKTHSSVVKTTLDLSTKSALLKMTNLKISAKKQHMYIKDIVIGSNPSEG
jgi:hypothetical protein